MLVLRGLVCFPETVMHFDVGRLKSVAALNAAMKKDQTVFLVTQKDVAEEDPSPNGLYRMGVVAKVKQILKLPHDNFRIVVEGEYRASIAEIVQQEPHYIAVVEERFDRPVTNFLMAEALVRQCRDVFEEYAELVPKMAPDVLMTVVTEDRPGYLADYIASNLGMPYEEKQRILNLLSVNNRVETLLRIIHKECQVLQLERKIEDKVQQQMDDNQRDYYLREQIRAISEELGEEDNPVEESAEYVARVEKLGLPDKISEPLIKECRKLGKMPTGSHEATVVRGYLDTCLSLPWNDTT